MLGIILITLCFIIMYTQYFVINRDYWKKRNIKQVNNVLWNFLRGKQSMPEIIKDIYDAHPELPHVGIFLGSAPTLILRDLENIKTVLHGDFQSFHARGFITNTTDILTDNLFFVDDYNRWKLQRLKMSQFFSKTQLKKTFCVMEKRAKIFIDSIESNNHQIVDNPYEAMYAYTTACISSAIFGIDTETPDNMETQINKISFQALKTTLMVNLKFAVARVAPKLYKFLNLSTFEDYQQSFINILQKSMEKRKSGNEICHDFIDTCIQFENEGVLIDFATGYKTNTNIEFLAAQAFVFLLGGIDTITTTLHFTLLELANNSKILQKVHHEVDKFFEKNGDNFSFEAVENMEYTEQVINEVLRKNPVVGLTQRKCTRDTVLPTGNIKVDKGVTVIIPIFALHRDANYFSDPDVFDPEHFSAENMSKIVKYSYMPFGKGKRNCIGTRLAYMQMKVCLAWLLRKYTLKEYCYSTKHFEPSFFAMRDPKAYCKIIPRTY